ncbi:MAG: hypothetical protein N2511_05300 [Thermodesulfovibrionales bacterium]|nr:hypothetical protein [Thermodesulfovibrionales bacterium]
MKRFVLLAIIIILIVPLTLFGQTAKKAVTPPVSSQTAACIGCHKTYTPGIVEDWQKSLHANTTPAMALKKSSLERRVSADKFDASVANVVVGCYECHSINPTKHKDNFNHMGYKINTVVSPIDCATCHPVEARQFSGSKKAHAYGNLTKNPVFSSLVDTIVSVKKIENGKVIQTPASASTRHETCFACHGTEVKVNGLKEVDTAMGKIKVPALSNWPNQGVGRINPDGSLGACSACHPRHSFSIEIARKPYTCAQCHLDPDVPAWNVYKESKHGNIYFSKYQDWNFKAVPWKVGKDFQAPTCATCHNSLITTADNKVIIDRTHDFGARLWIRLFGLVYSHPQPIHGDTSVIKNKDGLPLPTTFTGEVAETGLISRDEQSKRQKTMQGLCKSCHTTQWTTNHFVKLENTIKEVDNMTLSATLLLLEAWKNNLAEGLIHGKNPFDDAIEQMWIRQWLFYGNSIKYSSAMTGAPDYATFKNGWWNLTENLQHMSDWIEFKKTSKGSVKK